jgi:hypothetical protein
VRRADTIVAVLFGALGVFLVVSGTAFPAGIGGIPGAGFFPEAIGVLMGLLAIALSQKGRRQRSDKSMSIANLREVATTAGLLLAYLLLWGTGWFLVRTTVFLAITLIFLGQRWLPSLGYSAALSVFAYLAFDIGLNVTLE